jgi:hypothetical protein
LYLVSGKTLASSGAAPRPLKGSDEERVYEGPTHYGRSCQRWAHEFLRSLRTLEEKYFEHFDMKVPGNKKKNNILSTSKIVILLVVVDEVDLLVSESNQMVEGPASGC